MKYFVKSVKSNSDKIEFTVHFRKGGKLLHYEETRSSCRKYVEQEALHMNIRHYRSLEDAAYKKLAELLGGDDYNGFVGIDKEGNKNEFRTTRSDLLC